MKVELQCGDTITIPNGCKAVIKDGDVLVLVVNGKRCNAFIYKSTDKRGFHYYYVGLDVCNQISISESPSNRWSNNDLSYSTEEEKQQLFDKMKEQGLKWNAEDKRVEKMRWRAKKGEGYYFIDNSVHTPSHQEDDDGVDNQLWNAYNYFRTREQARKAAEVVKETLRKYHEEIGE